jgi:hypothetical protein
MDMATLDSQLDALEARIPEMLKKYLDMQGFWNEFAGETDYLFEQAGEHFDYVRGRVDKMISDHVMIPGDG